MAGGPGASKWGSPGLGQGRDEDRRLGHWTQGQGASKPAPRGCPSVPLRSCLGKKAGPG